MIDRISNKIGEIVSLLIIVIMFFTTIEVVLRYVFSSPTIWVWPLNRQIFGVYILIAGIYAMSKNEHIRIEVFYNLFSKKIKFISYIVSTVFFTGFMSVIVWQGVWMGKNSWIVGEKASGAFPIPLYPLKMLIPLAGLLFLVEGICIFTRNR